YHVTWLHDVVVNLQPYRRFGEQPHQQHLAPLDRFAPQVIAVKLDQVEGCIGSSTAYAACPSGDDDDSQEDNVPPHWVVRSQGPECRAVRTTRLTPSIFCTCGPPPSFK